MSDILAEIGIIGGTGVYDPDILEEPKDVKISTPFGATSSLITVGTYEGKNIAFLSRHGPSHQIPPHKIPNQANIWALRKIGVKRIIASSAVGSLREDYKPGDFVMTDQFIDRTKKRLDTFYEGGQLCHISAADPICPQIHEYFVEHARKLELKVHPSGTYICIEGPRFSTRAESKLFRQWGCDIIGMTLYPEVILAREAQLCYVSIAMVTDYDVWAEKPVSAQEVIETMEKNSENFKKLIMTALPEFPEKRLCDCGESLKFSLM
ncbi:S-methyl-5'-thioadenosine phosphorylase [Candidatus Bathyarchaeota archaeon]|jgi:5'-methylthioadenosine phosphorylase|nr:S-methyl-5'-thioadenosine phosphorylase [Candidatus Bathyarchaeota archaeon]